MENISMMAIMTIRRQSRETHPERHQDVLLKIIFFHRKRSH